MAQAEKREKMKAHTGKATNPRSHFIRNRDQTSHTPIREVPFSAGVQGSIIYIKDGKVVKKEKV